MSEANNGYDEARLPTKFTAQTHCDNCGEKLNNDNTISHCDGCGQSSCCKCLIEHRGYYVCKDAENPKEPFSECLISALNKTIDKLRGQLRVWINNTGKQE